MVVYPARAHRDPAVLAAQRARLAEPPVAPLNDLAIEMERSTGHVVPRFDPQSGGVDAEALLLLESPGPAATKERGSGIISVFNDDVTAQHLHELLTCAGVAVERVLLWNVVPWWLPAESSAGSFRAPRRSDLTEAAPWLDRALRLLPELRVIITLGRKAEKGLAVYAVDHSLPYPVIACPHAAAQAWNRDHLRQATQRAFGSLATLLDGTPGTSHPERLDFWP